MLTRCSFGGRDFSARTACGRHDPAATGDEAAIGVVDHDELVDLLISSWIAVPNCEFDGVHAGLLICVDTADRVARLVNRTGLGIRAVAPVPFGAMAVVVIGIAERATEADGLGIDVDRPALCQSLPRGLVAGSISRSSQDSPEHLSHRSGWHN